MDAVLEVARLAGDNAMTYYRTSVTVEAKADGSPVTVADRSSEEAARAWIARKFASDGVVGEEFDPIRPEAKRQWIIDPIDGTKAFVRGVPLWGTLVAVMEGDRVIAGAAYFPAVGSGETIAAAEGAGAWWNGVRCRVSTVGNLREATVLTTDTRFRKGADRWDALAREAAIARTWGDCFGYLLVATGRAEAMVDETVSIWDIASWKVIVREAGGVCTDWGKGAIATNAALSDAVRSRLS